MSRETILAFSAIFIAGCATVVPVSTPPYFPPNPSAVLLSHKGELRASASASTGGETVTAAYALTQHFGMLASGSAVLRKSGDPNGNQYSGEIGAGFFDTTTSKSLCSEVYGGIGWGIGNSTFQTLDGGLIPEIGWQISGNEQTRFATAWIQGAAGYDRNNFSVMILLRISDVDVYHDMSQESVRGAGLDNNESVPHDTTVSGTGNVYIWFIPGFEVRYGLDRIQLIASIFGTQFASGEAIGPLVSAGLSYEF